MYNRFELYVQKISNANPLAYNFGERKGGKIFAATSVYTDLRVCISGFSIFLCLPEINGYIKLLLVFVIVVYIILYVSTALSIDPVCLIGYCTPATFCQSNWLDGI